MDNEPKREGEATQGATTTEPSWISTGKRSATVKSDGDGVMYITYTNSWGNFYKCTFQRLKGYVYDVKYQK